MDGDCLQREGHLVRDGLHRRIQLVRRECLVRGISHKLQEEERERRLDFVPEISALEAEEFTIDPSTKDMLDELNFKDLAVNVEQPRR